MRNEKWTVEQNNEATARAYKSAIRDGAFNLAHNIKHANPQIDWAQVDTQIRLAQAKEVLNQNLDDLTPPETV